MSEISDRIALHFDSFIASQDVKSNEFRFEDLLQSHSQNIFIFFVKIYGNNNDERKLKHLLTLIMLITWVKSKEVKKILKKYLREINQKIHWFNFKLPNKLNPWDKAQSMRIKKFSNCAISQKIT